MAALLAGEGHHVRSLPERAGRGPVPDLDVCGTPVEVKSFLPLAERGRPPTAWSVCNKLLAARAQAPTAVLFARGSGLGVEAARSGVAEFAARAGGGRAARVRVVGDGFDLSWSPHALRSLAATVPAASRSAPAPTPRLPRPPGRRTERSGGVSLP